MLSVFEGPAGSRAIVRVREDAECIVVYMEVSNVIKAQILTITVSCV